MQDFCRNLSYRGDRPYRFERIFKKKISPHFLKMVADRRTETALLTVLVVVRRTETTCL